MKRVLDLLGQQPVRGDRVGHAGGLDRDLEVLELEPLHQLDELDCGRTSASTEFSRSSSCRCLGSEPEFTPIRIGVPVSFAFATTSADLVGAADVARVEAHAVRAGVEGLEGERVVEVDVGDHRDRRLLHDPLERLDVVVARHRAAHDVPAGLRDRADLPHGGVVVGGLRLGHRLDRHRRAAADGHASDPDLPARGHRLEGTGDTARVRLRGVPAEVGHPASRAVTPPAGLLRVQRFDLVCVLLGDRLALELHRSA